MVKKILLVFCVLLFILSGCGAKQEPLSSTGQDLDAKLDFIDSSELISEDPLGEMILHYGAVFENTNEYPLEIVNMEITFLGEDRRVIGNVQEVNVNPSVVKPGERVYLSETVPLPLVKGSKDYKEAVPRYRVQIPTPAALGEMETSNINSNENDGYTIQGTVRNTTEATVNLVQVTAGLYNENEHIIAVMVGSVNSELPPGESVQFRLAHPNIPSDIIQQIKEIDVKASPARQS